MKTNSPEPVLEILFGKPFTAKTYSNVWAKTRNLSTIFIFEEDMYVFYLHISGDP